MGCWNGTCMISNLPIICGEKVVIIPLIEKQQELIKSNFDLNGCCYSTDELQPIMIPFYGEYNDYGSIERIGTSDEVLFKEFYDLYKFNIKDDYKYENTAESFFECVERGLVSINGRKVRFVFIKKNIYEEIIKHIDIEAAIWRSSIDEALINFVRRETYSPYISIFDTKITKYKSGIENLFKLVVFLSRTRNRFYLPSGSGSQQYDTTYNKLLAEWILEYINSDNNSLTND